MSSTFLVALFVEHRKLRRSLVLVLASVMPVLIGVFSCFNVLRTPDKAQPWDMWMQGGAAIWAFFLLPMGVTAMAALIASIEHTPRSWDYLRALPVPRWMLYAAKAAWLLGALAIVSLAVASAIAAGAQAAAWLEPAVSPTGGFHLLQYASLFLRIYLSALLLVMVQLWVSLRFASFVPALALGIAGTFVAVVATSARIGAFLPWQIPVNMLSTDPQRAALALWVGIVGGVLALIAMLAHLHHSES